MSVPTVDEYASYGPLSLPRTYTVSHVFNTDISLSTGVRIKGNIWGLDDSSVRGDSRIVPRKW